MQCPKCQATMEEQHVLHASAHRCLGCEGLWFRMREDAHLLPHAVAIDTGLAETGAQYNALDRIHCPECEDHPLIRMVDAHQPHIWFESCKRCYGRFFDAGEFRDLAEYTVDDFLKKLSVNARD